jgi:hypothetical protein
MKTLSRQVAKFTSLIVAVLPCFDRFISIDHRWNPRTVTATRKASDPPC